MTIIEVRKVKRGQNIGEILKKIIDDRCCLSLLRFFLVHPNGRFSKLAIIHGLDGFNRRPEVENALDRLVNDGVLKESIENKVCYFQLTNQEPIRHMLLDLARFDWHRCQMVLENI